MVCARLCTASTRLPIHVLPLPQRLCAMCMMCAVLEATPQDEGPGAQSGAQKKR